jgi:hypothetical protein
MNPKYVITGTMTDTRTITLDQVVPITGERVRVTVEEMTTAPKLTMQEAVAEIRRRQKERGHVPMTTAEIEALFGDSSGENPE